MRGLGLYTAILTAVVLVFFGVIYWPSIEKFSKNPVPDARIEEYDLELTESYLKKSRPDEAIHIIGQYQDQIEKQTQTGQQWLALLIQASEQSLDTAQLMMIQEYFPGSLQNYEKASLLVAEAYIMSGREDEYETLRNQWIGRETYKDAWFLLDADHLLTQGNQPQAVAHLEGQALHGKEETGRLVRLALIHSVDSPMLALDFLDKALAKDPSNGDVLLYRTKLLENMGEKGKALEGYTQAVRKNPKNLFIRDQLADYYLRQHQNAMAIKTWKDGLALPGSDFLWVKALFLSRMTDPAKIDWQKISIPQGELKPLVEYMLKLNNDQIWDEEAFEKLPDSKLYAETQQAVFWLRMIDAMKADRQETLWNGVQNNPFNEELWNPELELALLQLLNFRKTGNFLSETPWTLKEEPKHPLLQAMANGDAEVAPDLQALLMSPEAYTAILLASGWTEAALQVHHMDVIPDNMPEWYTLELTQAMRKSRGENAALNFANKQKQTSDLELLSREMAARVALNEGDLAQADRIYQSLESSSPEAKSYLARKAFKEKNWKKAQQLTEELILIYPDNQLLKDNLKKIQEHLP